MDKIKEEHERIIDSREIERAHRLGSYRNGRSRPVIVKFAHFKDKDRILSLAHKFKGSSFGLSEDFSPATRLARKHLIEYGKTNNLQFKLRYDKLLSGGKTFVYDQQANKVVERKS